MRSKHKEILSDAFLNLTASIPIKQIATLHKCSPQYISQVCRGYGVSVDRKKGVVSAPIGTLNKIFWER